MSKIPLPPPPGFRRHKKVLGKSVRYVYPFSESKKGAIAAEIHAAFLAEEEEQWKKSKLRKIAIRRGRQAIKSLQLRPQSVKNHEAIKIGLTLAGMDYPLFMRRNPLDQVFEHLRHQPRYFMKIDIADAFRCVYPGFHERFPRPLLVHDGNSKAWDGWPFFHPGQNGLIQGAPSSPLLFEKACALSGLDELLRDTAKANNATVSRYVDDIVFSRLPWDNRPFGKRMYTTLSNRIEACGFRLSRSKNRRCIDTHHESIAFLGVSVYKDRVKVDPKFFARIAHLGYLSDGHLGWLDQIEDLRQLLELNRNKRTSIY